MSNIAASKDADTSGYTPLQKKAAEVIGQAQRITQFLDRDTNPNFAGPNGMQAFLLDFLQNPDQDVPALRRRSRTSGTRCSSDTSGRLDSTEPWRTEHATRLRPPCPTRPAGGRVPALEPRKRGRYSLLTRRDKVALGLMVGVPLILDLALIWGPTLRVSCCSHSRSGRYRPRHGRGLGRPEELRVAAHGIPVLLAGPRAHPVARVPDVRRDSHRDTPLAVLLDRELRGSGFFQSVFYLPVVLALAVVGIIWTLQYAPEQGFINNALGRTSNDTLIDWLGNPTLNIWAAMVAASGAVGYVMVLYLAGLKSVDPGLREAAKVDGANERQTFLHVTFPVMAPINIVIVVVTTIEALRAFDIVYIINRGKNGLELLSTLITNNGISESNRVGFASSIAVVLLLISLVPIVIFLSRTMREGRR